MVWTCPTYGCSDIAEVVSWHEDTEAADVMALGREFHSGIVLGVKDFSEILLSCSVVAVGVSFRSPPIIT